jgi:fructose-1,6-bisphosphatase I
MQKCDSPSLLDYLTDWVAQDVDRASVAITIVAVASATEKIARLMAQGPLAAGGNQELHAASGRLILDALKSMPVAYVAMAGEQAILTLSPGAPLALAVEPLDSVCNADSEMVAGTIFSLYQRAYAGATASFLRPGHEQLAAGYVIYGPHTALVLSIGHGVDLFILDPEGGFRLAHASLGILPDANEFAINASNYRHWTAPIRTFIDDCLEGADGPQGRNFNMRWVGSLVAEAHRIFFRGGVFLSPAEIRPGFERGRLSLLFEAAPIALLAERAGGAASDGTTRILDKVPGEPSSRTPLIVGSARSIAVISDYHINPAFARDMSPLFHQRGLFSA